MPMVDNITNHNNTSNSSVKPQTSKKQMTKAEADEYPGLDLRQTQYSKTILILFNR